MSWIVSANCFNGLVCIGDIQATITFNNGRKPEHVNCVKKIHKIYDNLIVPRSTSPEVECIQKLNLPKSLNFH
jgi:hypothetical protein